jgi:hypothetical protein
LLSSAESKERARLLGLWGASASKHLLAWSAVGVSVARLELAMQVSGLLATESPLAPLLEGGKRDVSRIKSYVHISDLRLLYSIDLRQL